MVSNNDSKLALLVLMVLSPLLSLPFTIKAIYEKRYYALNYLALFMALMAYLWIPSGDLYRFYIQFDALKDMDFDEMVEFCNFDFLMYFLMWCYSKLELNFEWFRLITCMIEYLLIFGVLKSIIQNNMYGRDKKNCFMIFFIMFGLLQFSVFLTGARFTMSLAVFIKANHLLFTKRKKSGFVYLLVACLCHYSFWPVLLLALAAFYIKPHLNRKLVLILGGVAFSVSTLLLIYLIDILPISEAFLNHLDNYTTGYFANGELEDYSYKFRLVQILSIIGFYALTIFSFLRLKEFRSVPMFILLLLFCILLINMNSAYNRYATIAIWAMLPYFLINPDLKFQRNDLKIMYCLSIFVFLTSVYSVRRELKFGDQMLIATPIPAILMHSYSNHWIDQNIGRYGNIIKSDS